MTYEEMADKLFIGHTVRRKPDPLLRGYAMGAWHLLNTVESITEEADKLGLELVRISPRRYVVVRRTGPVLNTAPKRYAYYSTETLYGPATWQECRDAIAERYREFAG